MHKCLELSKLPKAPRIFSINFRRQTPGSVGKPSELAKPHTRLDPKHPIDLLSRKQKHFLWALPTSAFTLGAMPMGLLIRPEIYATRQGRVSQNHRSDESFDSWSARVARGAPTGTVAPMMLNEPQHTRLAMSLQMQSSRDFRTHQRTQVLRRFKTAIGLIVTRGASAMEVKGRLRLVFDDTDVVDGWVLQGWTYYLRPSLQLYRMPYPELVHLLRPALRELWTRGTEMEADWTAATLGRRGSHTGDSRSASDNEWSRSRPSFKSSSRNYASPTTTASASTPAHNSSSRQTYPRSESGLARTTTRDTPFGLRKETGRQAEPSSDQKPRKPHKISVSPELLLAEPNFDPFPTVHVAPPESAGGTTKSVSRTGVPNLPLHVDPQDILPKSLPPEPDFDPFPSVPAASLPAIATSRDIPTPLPASPPKSHTATSAKTTKPKGPNDTNWWAIGRKIEAAIGQDVEGPTRWDRATDTPSPAQPHAVGQQTLSSSAPKKQEAGESVQSRLSGMLYQQAEVARPDTHERAARRIPRQTHRFEVK